MNQEEMSKSLSFKPFAVNPEKQTRYEKYLVCVKNNRGDALHLLQPKSMTEWEREREKVKNVFIVIGKVSFYFLIVSNPPLREKFLWKLQWHMFYCGHLNPILTVNPSCFANHFIDIVYLRLNLSEQHYSTNRSTHLWRQDSSAPGQARKPTTPERMRTWTTQRPTTRPKPSSWSYSESWLTRKSNGIQPSCSASGSTSNIRTVITRSSAFRRRTNLSSISLVGLKTRRYCVIIFVKGLKHLAKPKHYPSIKFWMFLIFRSSIWVPITSM